MQYESLSLPHRTCGYVDTREYRGRNRTLTKIFPILHWPYRPNSLSLYLLEKLTFSHCVTEGGDVVEAASCATDHGKQLCTGAEGSCVVWLDGYTVQVNPIWLLVIVRRHPARTVAFYMKYPAKTVVARPGDPCS